MNEKLCSSACLCVLKPLNYMFQHHNNITAQITTHEKQQDYQNDMPFYFINEKICPFFFFDNRDAGHMTRKIKSNCKATFQFFKII